eukprot:m.201197 g.201197  ORF g.201197 m.201197 type:complete len:301 (+) comp21932_c1_seq7:37-939(+)
MPSNRDGVPDWVKFAFGGGAGMIATVFVQPMDLVKNRMQVAGAHGQRASLSHTVSALIKNEGFFGLYNGLSAGLFRQATYTTTRLGVYTSLFDQYQTHFGSPGIIAKLGIGMTAGGIGAVVGTPADLALIRMSADGAQPPELRRNYKNVFDALLRVTREEGVLGMWKGCGPTVGRALVVNAAQLACYSQAKEQLLALGTFGEGIGLHFAASMVSGLATTAASMPVDILKTRLQNMRVVNGVPQYKGAMDVFTQIVQKEGVFALWRGFLPYWSRLGPHTVITFVFMEQMYNTYQRLVLHNA